MWFWGMIAGAVLGGMSGSVALAIFLAGVFGVLAHVFSQNKHDHESAADSSDDPLLIGVSNELRDLKRKVQVLEKRLSSVEAQLAQGSFVPKGLANDPEAATHETAAAMSSTLTDAAPEPVAVTQPFAPTIVVNVPAPARIDTPTVPETFDYNRFEDEVPAAPRQRMEVPPLPEPPSASQEPAPGIADDRSPPSRPLSAKPVLEPDTPAVSFRDRVPGPISMLLYGGNTLVKLGVLILFLGIAFLLRYTAERVTVPIELRYAGVALAGAGLLALGWFLRRRRADYALIMQGMGVGVFYLTTLSAMKLHPLIAPEMGFGFMFAVSLLGAALAILQNAPVLAIIAALEGFATPILTSIGGNHMMGLFTYLAILDAGIVLIAWFNAWRILNLICFVGTFTLSSAWANQYYTNDQYVPVQAFLILLFLMFTAVGVFFSRRTLLDSKLKLHDDDSLAHHAGAALAHVGRVDSALVFGTPLTAFGMQYLLSLRWEFGPAFSALAFGVFYLLLARVVFSRERPGLALLAEAYAIVGVIFATLAIPLGFEGVWAGSAWAVEGAGMYWLGARQQRPYSRAFAYLVMVGAACKLLGSMSLNLLPEGPVLHGSTIGPVLFALSAFVVWILHQRAALDADESWEAIPGRLTLWLGMAAVTLLPWQWLEPPMAAAATAALSVFVFFLARSFYLAVLSGVVASQQMLAVAGLIATLHRTTGAEVNAALESGWRGMLAALIIAASLLLTAAWNAAEIRRIALERGDPPDWSVANVLAMGGGVILLHLATLFAISLEQAAILWPITACAVLWVALRMSHGTLASVAAGLHIVSVGLFFHAGGFVDVGIGQGSTFLSAYAHLHFWIPLVFALVAWLSGDWISLEAKRLLASIADESSGGGAGRFNAWCAESGALWLPVLWGLSWWMLACCNETIRVLVTRELSHFLTVALVALVVLTSVLVSVLARWRQWPQMGASSLFTLPALVLCALIDIAVKRFDFLPSAHLGAIVWPLALVWHLRLLNVQRRWLLSKQRQPVHVAGFWFFLLLASRECQVRFEDLGDPYSSWVLLGWVVMPALSFWLLRSSLLKRRWPLTEFRRAYLEIACLPVAVYLLSWCFIGNLVSAGNASPLPYVPILNPLELGQWLVLAALLLWWRALSDKSFARLSDNTAKAVAGGMGWFLLTAMVLRTCHHLVGVAWEASALFESRLAQAALSIAWAIMGLLAMVLGNRRVSRSTWLVGAVLLGVVVVKLFVIELADRGGLYRIVSFIGVGVLLLIVGYFAPVPVKAVVSADEERDNRRAKEAP